MKHTDKSGNGYGPSHTKGVKRGALAWLQFFKR